MASIKQMRVTNEELIEALENSGGICAAAARYCQVHFGKRLNRNSVNKRVLASEELQEARNRGIQAMGDVAESKLYNAINDGNMTAVIFFLKTRFKDRGYVEKQEIAADVKAEVKATVSPFAKLTKEELWGLLGNETPAERKSHA